MNEYRYRRENFHPLPVKAEHLELYIDFRDGRVAVVNTLRLTARQSLDLLALDARDLEIGSVVRVDEAGKEKPLAFTVRAEAHKLDVSLGDILPAGVTFTVRTRTVCTPSDRILEGIYQDSTPPGCPQQYMSQCQQWGFQRIAPVLDDCTAKCTFTTTIEADARYTHLISNGNVSRNRNPTGKPEPKPGDPSRKVITYENAIPMAPYLFICCAGTWDELDDEAVYPDGRRVKLEYLVPPGRLEGARGPMAILKDSVLWQGRTQDYAYPREVSRTITMEKSNFGGMENVGNTTIVTDAALIDRYTSDRRLFYAHAVIVHEFEHNQCGSDVTMETPFDMWLNEAFTVDVERQYMADRFDPDGMRLDEVDSMRDPVHGPLAIEQGGHLGLIVREGFNDPDELVDGVTYVKAAEVIRMLKLLLGRDTFRRAKNLYFSRHNGGNANTDQFFACFTEASGRDLSQFRREWLHTIGYPVVAAESAYDVAARRLRVRFTQSRTGTGGLFLVPLVMAAVDAQGRDIPGTARLVELTGPVHEEVFENVPAPAFLSFNRDCSFYGVFEDRSATAGSLKLQIRLDPNRFNRVEAMRRLTERERRRLVLEPAAEPSADWVETYAGLVRDASLPAGFKAALLRVDETPLDRTLLPKVRELFAARLKLIKAVADRHFDEVAAAFRAVDTYKPDEKPGAGIESRRLKGALLRVLVEARTPEAQAMAEAHFRAAWNITDQLSALAAVRLSEHPKREAITGEAFEMWKDHLSAYTGYLGALGSSARGPGVLETLRREAARPGFRWEHPSHSRSLVLPAAANNGVLWTEEGLRWAVETVARLAPVSEYVTLGLLASFQLFKQFEPELQRQARGALLEMRGALDPDKTPAVCGRLDAYLKA
jgi:aminopeptidase N